MPIDCPQCGLPDAGVTDSRESYGQVKRRRTCPNGHYFKTYEFVHQGRHKAPTVPTDVWVEVLRYYNAGLSNAEIAQETGLGWSTVQSCLGVFGFKGHYYGKMKFPVTP